MITTRRSDSHTLRGVLFLLIGFTLLLVPVQAQAGAKSPGCDTVTGKLDTSVPGQVTAHFDVTEVCREVSVLSWLAPDAHAGQPQELFDRKGENDVAPGHYDWTINAPPLDCFHQFDLRVPGRNVDAILGGTHKCETPPTTTTTESTTTTVPATTTTTVPETTTTVLSPPTTAAPPSEELPRSGAPVGLLALVGGGALALGGLSILRGRQLA